MTIFILAIIIAAVCVYIVNKKNESHRQQPIHFVPLDDNGDPIPEQQPSEPVIQELQYFCIKDKGYHVSVWPKDQNIGDYIEFDIAGMSYRENIGDYFGERAGTLEEEPDNPYDANAIKVLADDGHHVGYVPKDMTDEVRKFTTLPCKCYIYIGEHDGAYFSDCYVKN